MKLGDLFDEGSVAAALAERGLPAAKAELFAGAARALGRRGVAAAEEVHALFVPGRIEVLGKHTDYAGGRSIVAAVERGFCAVARPRSDARLAVEAVARNERLECLLSPELSVPSAGWRNYPLTVARRLARNFGPHLRGADIAFLSDLPMAAGMSSSSAFMVATYMALAAHNDFGARPAYRACIRTDLDLAAYLGTVENGQSFGCLAGDRGVGTFGGSEDHVAILCSEAGRLGQFAYCPTRLERRLELPPQYAFAVGFCGIAAEKTGAAQALYNRAALQVSAIVAAWRRATGGEQVYLAEVLAAGPDAPARLRQVLAQVEPAPYAAGELLRRLEHFLVEDGQIIDAASAALARGDMAGFGAEVDRSQRAGAELLGNQIEQTVDMARLARECGALAASAFGAGFGGGVWALVERADAGAFARAWEQAYAAAHPRAAARAQYFLSRPGPGAFAL